MIRQALSASFKRSLSSGRNTLPLSRSGQPTRPKTGQSTKQIGDQRRRVKEKLESEEMEKSEREKRERRRRGDKSGE
jgi:hypothetical protein